VATEAIRHRRGTKIEFSLQLTQKKKTGGDGKKKEELKKGPRRSLTRGICGDLRGGARTGSQKRVLSIQNTIDPSA